MSMRIHKAGQHGSPRAIQFSDFVFEFSASGVPQDYALAIGSDDLLAYAQDGGIFDQAKVAECASPSWTVRSRCRSQGQELANVCQQQPAISRGHALPYFFSWAA